MTRTIKRTLGLRVTVSVASCAGDPLSADRVVGDLAVRPVLDFAAAIRDSAWDKLPDWRCQPQSALVMPAKHPIDIILVVANSGSFPDVFRAIELNTNQNFTRFLDGSGIDYRIILFTRFGDWITQGICIPPPASGNNCAMPVKGPPVNAKRLFHYDQQVGIQDSLELLLGDYKRPDRRGLAPNGWAGLLRPAAFKVFVEVTNSDGSSAAAFDFNLRALDPKEFGTDQQRNYTFHAVVGLAPNNPPAKPWAAKDPEQAKMCGVEAVNNGANYQQLAILTRDLRFPICQASFDGIFQELTRAVEGASLVPCQLALPRAEPPDVLDVSSLHLEFTPSVPANAPPEKWAPVRDALACMPSTFYVKSSNMVLCPESCLTLQRDPVGSMRAFASVTKP